MSWKERYRRFTRNPGCQVLGTIAAAIIFFLIAVHLGKAGDCAPHEIDGQCGLSTFVGFLYGVAGALVILVTCGVAIAIDALRRGRRRARS